MLGGGLLQGIMPSIPCRMAKAMNSFDFRESADGSGLGWPRSGVTGFFSASVCTHRVLGVSQLSRPWSLDMSESEVIFIATNATVY